MGKSSPRQELWLETADSGGGCGLPVKQEPTALLCGHGPLRLLPRPSAPTVVRPVSPLGWELLDWRLLPPGPLVLKPGHTRITWVL